MESNKEKLARLLAANKTRLDRDALILRYQEIGYHPRREDFLDPKVSNELLKEIYHKVSTLSGQHFKSYHEIVETLQSLCRRHAEIKDKHIYCFYLFSLESGGLKMILNDFWSMLSHQPVLPSRDVLVVAEQLEFGLCVEFEEYDYLLTTWGFEPA